MDSSAKCLMAESYERIACASRMMRVPIEDIGAPGAALPA